MYKPPDSQVIVTVPLPVAAANFPVPPVTVNSQVLFWWLHGTPRSIPPQCTEAEIVSSECLRPVSVAGPLHPVQLCPLRLPLSRLRWRNDPIPVPLNLNEPGELGPHLTSV